MAKAELEELIVADAEALRAWLTEHHAASEGVWLALTKKGGAVTTLTWQQAVEEALCFGWIDGQARKGDQAISWIRFTRADPAVPGHSATSSTWPGWRPKGGCCRQVAPRCKPRRPMGGGRPLMLLLRRRKCRPT